MGGEGEDEGEVCDCAVRWSVGVLVVIRAYGCITVAIGSLVPVGCLPGFGRCVRSSGTVMTAGLACAKEIKCPEYVCALIILSTVFAFLEHGTFQKKKEKKNWWEEGARV